MNWLEFKSLRGCKTKKPGDYPPPGFYCLELILFVTALILAAAGYMGCHWVPT